MNLMLEKYPDSSSVFLPSLLASRKFQGPRSEDSCPYREKASLLLTALRGGLAGVCRGPALEGTGAEDCRLRGSAWRACTPVSLVAVPVRSGL